MALDPRIILGGQAPQIEGPLDTYGKALSLKSLMNQSQMQDLQRQQVEKQMAKEGRLSQIAKSSGGDQMRMRDLLRNEGLWQEANQLDESITRQSKTKREEEKAQIESTLKRFEAVGQLMNGVKDQASWENAIGVAVRDFGAKMTDFPPQYDPNFIEQKRQMALPVKEQLEQKWKALNFDLDNKKFDYQQTNDAANRGVQVRGQDLNSQTAIRGQNLTNARAIETNQVQRETNQSKRNTDLEMKLADDYTKQSKDYQEINAAVTKINSALNSASKSPAATLAAGTSFMKLLDPGSVVRESELGMALAASGVFDRALNYFNTLKNGRTLTESQVSDFRTITAQIHEAAKQSQLQIDESYKGRAGKYNLNPDNIITDLGQSQSGASRTQGKPKPSGQDYSGLWK